MPLPCQSHIETIGCVYSLPLTMQLQAPRLVFFSETVLEVVQRSLKEQQVLLQQLYSLFGHPIPWLSISDDHLRQLPAGASAPGAQHPRLSHHPSTVSDRVT